MDVLEEDMTLQRTHIWAKSVNLTFLIFILLFYIYIE